MMRVLILGATGMLGHKLYQRYRQRFDVYGTVRSSYAAYRHYGIFDAERMIGSTDATNFSSVVRAVAQVQPDVIINCIGIIKQLKAGKDPLPSIQLNALFPHQLADLSRAANARLVHISTDCVFNGRGAIYTEDSPSDAEDLYGRTKYLGEVDRPGVLTIRTSIIGRELNSRTGLIEWFLSTSSGSRVQGFQKAVFTGFTTIRLAEIIADILENYPELHGLYQVSSEPINKYDLLVLVRDAFGVNITIEPDKSVQIDRSLDSTKFRAATGFEAPAWPTMIAELAQDPTPYDQWK